MEEILLLMGDLLQLSLLKIRAMILLPLLEQEMGVRLNLLLKEFLG